MKYQHLGWMSEATSMETMSAFLTPSPKVLIKLAISSASPIKIRIRIPQALGQEVGILILSNGGSLPDGNKTEIASTHVLVLQIIG